VLALLCAFLAGSCNPDEAGPLAASGPTDAPPDVPPVDTAPVVDSQPPQPPQPPQSPPPQSPQPPPVTYTGLPYGPAGLWRLANVKWGPQPFTASQNYINADSIVQQINAARAMGHRLILAMTGGVAEDYSTNGQFDLTKWTNKMDTYNTETIREAVAAAVSDGTVIGNQMIDEPETKRWGTVLTKAMIDQMAAYVKAIFPTLPVGLNHGPPGYKWRASERFTKVDYVLYQYNHYYTSGNIVAWRDAVLAQAKLDGVTPALSLNVLNGGKQDRDGNYDCVGAGMGGLGTRYPNCTMTADQVRTWSKELVPYACFMMIWQYDATYMSEAGNQDAFREIASLVASQPRRSCARP
jgi:hypothetical protein